MKNTFFSTKKCGIYDGVSKIVFNKFVKKKVKSNMMKYWSEKKKTHTKALILTRQNTSKIPPEKNNFCSKKKKILIFCGLFKETQVS